MSFKINIIDVIVPDSMNPIPYSFEECKVANVPYLELLKWKLTELVSELELSPYEWTLNTKMNFWPDSETLKKLYSHRGEAGIAAIVSDKTGKEECLAWFSRKVEQDAVCKTKIPINSKSVHIIYPWDLIAVNESVISEIKGNDIQGKVMENVHIDGFVEIGEGSVILPGVYIEGNALIGKNCKIGPNCYIRGNTSIGDKCHIGQSVEVKNSLIMDNVSIGHLSYVGDSVICNKTNFGAGTVTSNLRHDGKNHRCMVDDKLIDTGRRKFGVIVGENVHTGINTTIYPGRKIYSECSTVPAEIVKHDIKR